MIQDYSENISALFIANNKNIQKIIAAKCDTGVGQWISVMRQMLCKFGVNGCGRTFSFQRATDNYNKKGLMMPVG